MNSILMLYLLRFSLKFKGQEVKVEIVLYVHYIHSLSLSLCAFIDVERLVEREVENIYRVYISMTRFCSYMVAVNVFHAPFAATIDSASVFVPRGKQCCMLLLLIPSSRRGKVREGREREEC